MGRNESTTFIADRWFTTFDMKESVYGKVIQKLPTSQVLL